MGADRPVANRETSVGSGHITSEQIKTGSQMVIKLLLGCDGKWDELVGTFKEDGTKVVSTLTLLLLLAHC